MELFKANRQWATRPADERFENLETLYEATRAYADTAVESDVKWGELRVENVDGDVQLIGTQQRPAVLTNWAFGQLASRVKAPAEYLSRLPATLAAQNINFGLKQRAESEPSKSASLLIHRNGSMLVRALTSEKYSRIWNWEVAQKLMQLEQLGWEPARPDGMMTLNPSAMGGPSIERVPNASLYASDHDLFAFLRHDNLALDVPGATTAQRQRPLYRGVIVENSEVGASALKLTRFLYNRMCGNHIIWGASELVDFSVRHVGNIAAKMQRWEFVLNEYAEQGASEDEAVIARAQKTIIADTKQGVLDKLFGMRTLGIPQKTLSASFDAVVPDEDGDARTVWGMVQGLTRHSQTLAFADKRNDLDRAAGRVLEKIKF